MDDHFDICGVFKMSKFDIARLTCIGCLQNYQIISFILCLVLVEPKKGRSSAGSATKVTTNSCFRRKNNEIGCLPMYNLKLSNNIFYPLQYWFNQGRRENVLI